MVTSESIYEDQIRLLNKNIPRGLLLNSVIAIPFAYIMLLQSNKMIVLSWLVLFYATNFLRLIFHWYYFPPAQNKKITVNTRYLYYMGSVMSGAIWGSAILFFQPTTLNELLPIGMALCGIMAGGISVLSYFLLSYAAFSLPIATALAGGFFLIDQEISQALGYMTIIYLIACLYFSYSFNKVLTETLRLGSENNALLDNLRIKKQLAEKANMAKSRFLAAASHDLRQPLHALSLLFEAVKEADSREVRNSLYPKIDSSIEALSSLFNSLLDISKLDAGVVEPSVDSFYIGDVVRSIIIQHEPDAKAKKLSIRSHCGDFVVKSDHLFIERILNNLLSNAIRYTDTGGVLVSCRKRQRQILLQVWDTGIGIEGNEVEAVFGEFYQLHNPQRDRKHGLGLGLSIVRRLCQLLGLTLELRSQPGSGSVVSILLPQGDPQQVTDAEQSVERKNWNIAGLRVLVIDDDLEILKATSVLLENWGCVVLTAESSEEALENIGFTEQADFILSDLRLPGDINGVELLNSIRKRAGKNIPAILITGDTKPERIQLSQQSGYIILHKPLKPARLRTAIHMARTAKS